MDYLVKIADIGNKMLTDRKALYEEFMSTDLSLQQIADKYKKKKQWISWSIRKYIEKEGIVFYTREVTYCRICEAFICEKRIPEPDAYLRKSLEAITEKHDICKKCVENSMVRCGHCKTPVPKTQARMTGKNAWRCIKCNTEIWIAWYNKNKDHVRKYRLDRIKRILEENKNS